MTSGEQRYMAGYNEGRRACFRLGSADAARDWLAETCTTDDAYLAGYEWAVWDYEDANGLRHTPSRTPSRTPGAPGRTPILGRDAG